MDSLRTQALTALLIREPDLKAARVLQIDLQAEVGAQALLDEAAGIPGRPEWLELVPPTQIKSRSVRSPEGHAALLHALTHIELNAIDLALDAVFRFPGLPDAFYRDWMRVAKEEAHHFSLLRDHLADLGFRYGDFKAHNSLWEMAERTRHDVLARISLVPRTMEARGLDASPPIKAKLESIGDSAGAAILDIILRDEIQHVLIGNRWYGHLCEQRQLDPIPTYEALALKYSAPRPRGPFNLAARREAGFSEAELAGLSAPKGSDAPAAADAATP